MSAVIISSSILSTLKNAVDGAGWGLEPSSPLSYREAEDDADDSNDTEASVEVLTPPPPAPFPDDDADPRAL